MRVVPVIDLKAGIAVHAVRGERERYRPVHSVLAGADGDALALARAFRAELGLHELYVADLNAIGGLSAQAPVCGALAHDARRGDRTSVLGALAHEARVMVDAGVDEPAHARALLERRPSRCSRSGQRKSGAASVDAAPAVLQGERHEVRPIAPAANARTVSVRSRSPRAPGRGRCGTYPWAEP